MRNEKLFVVPVNRLVQKLNSYLNNLLFLEIQLGWTVDGGCAATDCLLRLHQRRNKHDHARINPTDTIHFSFLIRGAFYWIQQYSSVYWLTKSPSPFPIMSILRIKEIHVKLIPAVSLWKFLIKTGFWIFNGNFCWS